MGASNALAAFRLYAGKVPPTALNVLAYMALVALDRDGEPRYWEGHEALAVHCLGRDEASIDDSDLRAVRRAITPLFDAGAVTVVRHSSGRREKNVTVQYRLHLVTPAQDEKRPVENAPVTIYSPDGNRPTSEVITGRKVTDRRTKSDRSPDGNRPPEEEEDYKERDKTFEEYSLLSSDSVPSQARAGVDETEEMVQPMRAKLEVVPSSEPATPAAPDPTTPAPWLSLGCPYCGAEPGKWCINSGTGKTRDPHDARTDQVPAPARAS